MAGSTKSSFETIRSKLQATPGSAVRAPEPPFDRALDLTGDAVAIPPDLDAATITTRLETSFKQAGFPIERARSLGWRPGPEAKPKTSQAFVSKREERNELLVEGASFKSGSLFSVEKGADALLDTSAYTSGELRRAGGPDWQCFVLNGAFADTGERHLELVLEWVAGGVRHRIFCRSESEERLSFEATQTLLLAGLGIPSPAAWDVVETFDDT